MLWTSLEANFKSWNELESIGKLSKFDSNYVLNSGTGWNAIYRKYTFTCIDARSKRAFYKQIRKYRMKNERAESIMLNLWLVRFGAVRMKRMFRLVLWFFFLLLFRWFLVIWSSTLHLVFHSLRNSAHMVDTFAFTFRWIGNIFHPQGLKLCN